MGIKGIGSVRFIWNDCEEEEVELDKDDCGEGGVRGVIVVVVVDWL